MKNLFLKFIFLTIIYQTASSQNVPLNSEIQETLHSFFQEWNSKEKPGIVGAAIKDGKVIFQTKGGMANLEEGRVIDEHTLFQLSELSKQFVVLAALDLIERNKIQMEDPIHQYLPELKQFKHPILVKHLLNSSSGLHDYWVIKELKGRKDTDNFDAADMWQVINDQEKLDFQPGSDFLVSYTNVSLLGEIVEKVTGQSLQEVLNKVVFTPLGMERTHFSNDLKSKDNIAIPYRMANENYEVFQSNFDIEGPINLYSTLNDMAKWHTAMHQDANPISSLLKKMNSFAKTNNGSYEDTSLGRLTLGNQYMHAERGIDKIWQSGNTGAFSSASFYFPSKKLTTYVMGNTGEEYNGYLAMQMAGKLLEKEFVEPSFTDFAKMKKVRVPMSTMEKYCGTYWSEKWFVRREILMERDTLWYSNGRPQNIALIPITTNKFQFMLPGDDKVFMTFEEENGEGIYYVKNGSASPSRSVQFQHTDFEESKYATMEGFYINKAHHIVYELKIKDNQLLAIHKKNGSMTLTPVKDLSFNTGSRFLYGLRFMEEEGKMVGFIGRAPGLDQLFFEKMTLEGSTP